MKIAVVIPCYKVAGSILDVIASIGPEVSAIYVVDDACPQSSGNLVQEQCDDTRVRVLFHNRNQGVGGAVITGYQEAVQDGADIIVKLDGDGQMDAGLIPYFVEPIQTGEADYTKGNRFYEIESVTRMPAVRMIGNAGLSFLTKLSSGYWGLFDPTNGFTAISARVVAYLPLDKLARGYFFESDMLFRLNTLRAVVVDLPADAIYGDEISNLKIVKELPRFAVKNLTNFCKRILYNYFIRGFNYASLELVLGIGLTGFGVIFGLVHWLRGLQMESFASAGTVMLAGLSIMIGIQMLLGFLQYDISNQPTMALQRKIRPRALDRQQSHKKKVSAMILSLNQWAAIACVIGMSLGQVLFKVSAVSINESGSIFAPRTFLILASTFCVYAVVSVGWVWVLRKSQLGEVFPFYSLAYILVPLASYHLFNERFSNGYMLGVMLIIGGLLLCGRG